MKTELEYLLWFLRRSKITTQNTVNSRLSIVFLRSPDFIFKNIFNSFFLYFRIDPRKVLVKTELKYLLCFSRKCKKTASSQKVIVQRAKLHNENTYLVQRIP